MPTDLTVASGALALATIPFLVGGALVIQTDTPPSQSPTLGLLNHALWAFAIAMLAFGVAALLRCVDALRAGLAGIAPETGSFTDRSQKILACWYTEIPSIVIS